MKKNKILLSVLFFTSTFAYSQEGRVGINTVSPAATLDVSASPTISTRIDGLIAPRLKGTELQSKNALYTAAQDGAIVYVTEVLTATDDKTLNVTSIGYYYFDKTVGTAGRWMKVANPAAAYQEPWNVWETTTPATTNTQKIYQKASVSIGDNTSIGDNYNFAVGDKNTATGNQSMAIGSETKATGNRSFAGGVKSEANATQSFSFGDTNIIGSGANQSVAFGQKNTIAGGGGKYQNVTLGRYNTIDGVVNYAFGTSNTISHTDIGVVEENGGSLAVGLNNTINSNSASIAIGKSNTATSTAVRAAAIGESNTVSGIAAIALGLNNKSSGIASTAVGIQNISSSDASFAGGFQSDATNHNAFAFGNDAQASGTNSIALGLATKARGNESVAIGNKAETASNATTAIALGYDVKANAPDAVAFGNGSIANGQGSFATGIGTTTATGSGSFAGGNGAKAVGNNSIALGHNATASGVTSAAFGLNTTAAGQYSFTQGYGTNATNESEAVLGQFNLPVASAIFQVGDGTSSSQSNLISAIKGGIPADSWMAIGSGTNTPSRVASEKLRVYGGVNATGYWVATQQLTVPDYVFQKYYTGTSILKDDYNFSSNLYDVEKFLKENHHLPGVASASEIKKTGFYNLEDMQMQNLEKTEELYLYTIEQQKQIDELKNIVKKQQEQINQLLAK
jgi:hypothetical protein